MPRRTNEFQRLIAAIQGHLDPGSKVAESVLLSDRITGTDREVDVVISGKVGSQPITVSVECRDRARPADVTWVEQMQAKHSRLPTNVLVLCSHGAFSPEAHRIADAYGIRCCEFADVDAAAPERLFPDVGSLWGKAWEATIDRVRVTVEATGTLPEEIVRASPDNTLFLDDGSIIGSAAELANALLHADILVKRMAAEARPEHTYLESRWEHPVLGGRRLCLQKQEPLMLRAIQVFQVVAKCRVTVDEFPLRHGRYGGIRVAWSNGQMLGQPITLIASEDSMGASPKVTLKPSSGSTD